MGLNAMYVAAKVRSISCRFGPGKVARTKSLRGWPGEGRRRVGGAGREGGEESRSGLKPISDGSQPAAAAPFCV